MPFELNILILGESSSTNFYMSRAIVEPGKDMGDYYKLKKEIEILDEKCILEADVVTSLLVDFDKNIRRADGIVYFLNPLLKEEMIRFNMIIKNIFSVKKRVIPLIIVFYDRYGIVPISINELLEDIWVNYPSLEAFVNIPPHEFSQILHCLCLAMIKGEEPLNIETAWMRDPILIRLANKCYNNEDYYYAALAVKKSAMIAEIYNQQEYFIICEQAAYLFSKLNLYLEASKIMEKVDPIKWYNFKKKHADQMLTEGNKYFNRGYYETAAKQYENAAQWSSNELDGVKDKDLIISAFNHAIGSWVHACKLENAFKLLTNLPHRELLLTLREISDDIISAAEFLKERGEYQRAKEQLSIAIAMYRQENFSEELKNINIKLIDVLVEIFADFVTKKNRLNSLKTYEQIEGIWEYYNEEKSGLDVFLEKLISLFLEEYDIDVAPIVTSLLNKISSREVRERINNQIIELEEQDRLIRFERMGKQKSLLKLDQNDAKLKTEYPDFLRTKIDFLKKRKTLKSKWYPEVLEPLKIRDFGEAGAIYFKLAENFFYRKDFENTSLLILLGGLSLLKAGEPIEEVKENIKIFLKKFRKNEKSIKITFYVLLLFCIIDAILLNRDQYLKQIKKKLVDLPLLEEEKELIQI